MYSYTLLLNYIHGAGQENSTNMNEHSGNMPFDVITNCNELILHFKNNTNHIIRTVHI
jgi:hypothetical protein